MTKNFIWTLWLLPVLVSLMFAGSSRHRDRGADFQVCCIAGFPTCDAHDGARPAGWKIGVTAGLETSATNRGMGPVFAQRRRGFGGGRGYGGWRGGERYESYETPRQIPQHAFDENGEVQETPNWTNAPGFESDVFTFVRIRRNGGGWSGGPWSTDTPDSDLNLSWRLSTLTALKVNPDGRFLRLTDKDLVNYPFIYMVEPGSLYLDDAEAKALRNYLLNGGFLWLDDFWGEDEWNSMAQELKKVFPEPGRDWVELPLTHQLYHCVFNIQSKGQVPNVENGSARQFDPNYPIWEKGGREVHHRALFDDKGRIMVFATHNTDNGDGWEWEGNNHFYFEHFAEKIAYPLAINVIFYTMTH